GEATSPDFALFLLLHYRAHQFHHASAHLLTPDRRKQRHQFYPFRCGKQILKKALSLLAGFTTPRRPNTFEETRYWHVERRGDVEQTRRCDPVHAFLVFLHLLKCHAQDFRESFLAHSDLKPARPHSDTEPAVNRI